MTADRLISELASDPLERLRWMVMREFSIAPGSRNARRLKDQDVVLCGAHMAIDAGVRASALGEETAVNGSFDKDRFAMLSGGEI